MLRVAILGGAGFIGVSVVDRLLREHHRVQVLDTQRRLARAAPLIGGASSLETDDLSAAEIASSLRGFDVLIHLRWSSQPANSMTGMVEDAKENIGGGVDLFNQAATVGVRKIIFASSGGTVYGNTDVLPIPEDRPLRPVSAYGVSKIAVERYLQLMAFHHGLDGISLRVGNPYGPYQLVGVPIGVIARFVRCSRDHEPVRIYGDGSIVRDYIWIEDVAEAFAIAVLRPIPSGEYNIGSGEGHSLGRIVDLIERESGRKLLREHVVDRSFDARRIVLDISKFQTLSGWKPQVPIAEGVRRMIAAAQAAQDRTAVMTSGERSMSLRRGD